MCDNVFYLNFFIINLLQNNLLQKIIFGSTLNTLIYTHDIYKGYDNILKLIYSPLYIM